LFSHFIESLDGLATIRAFGWTAPYFTQTLALINEAQRPYYLLLCIQRWLVCVLDLVVAGLTVSIVGLAVILRSRVEPGLLGVSLVMMMKLGPSLAGFVQFFTQLETSLGAITRIKNFEQDTPPELLPAERADPASHWPKDGAVVFENVSLSYK
jgi:ATP-binding cassette, subfamily C (CFTR/MRP), member 1